MERPPRRRSGGTDHPLLDMRGITKRFPGVVANDRIDFDVKVGEVHALLGENGAGKSTLMRVAYGMYQPDEGEIRSNGARRQPSPPRPIAIAHGIGMIHQHFMLVPTLTVAENVALGLPSTRKPLTDLSACPLGSRELSGTYGLKVDPKAVRVAALGRRASARRDHQGAVPQRVAADPRRADGRPHAPGGGRPVRHLPADGRRTAGASSSSRTRSARSSRCPTGSRCSATGGWSGTVVPADVTQRDLAHMMVGRESAQRAAGRGPRRRGRLVGAGPPRARRPGYRGRPRPEPRGSGGRDRRPRRRVRQRSARVRGGGGGPAARWRRARSTIEGESNSSGGGAAEARQAGLGYVPEERMRDGVIGEFTVADNLMLIDNASPAYSRWGFLRSRRHPAATATSWSPRSRSRRPASTRRRTTSPAATSRSSSWRASCRGAARAPRRPADAGRGRRRRRVHPQRLIQQRDEGTAILIISEDLDEVLALSDRILVIYEGEIVGEAEPRTARARPRADDGGLARRRLKRIRFHGRDVLRERSRLPR